MSNLEVLRKQILACTRCELRAGASAPVPGFGSVNAKYLLIGEAPGQNEDRAGIPFVGLAGRRLNKLLALAGISENEIYLTNVVKCRPPKNRDPRKGEMAACREWLMEEIRLVKPLYVIALGRIPLSLFSPYGVQQMHGTMFEWEGIPVISQFHPAVALHQPRLWSTMLIDWQEFPEKIDANYIVVEPQQDYTCDVALDTENAPDGTLGEWSIAFRTLDGELCVASYYGTTPTPHIEGRTIMQHAKHDIRVLRAAKMSVPKNIVDTMIAAYCLGLGKEDVTSKSEHLIGGLSLKYLARRHLGMEMNTWQEVKDRPEMKQEYNAKDSVATLLLWEKWVDKLPQHFWDIDMPLLPVLMDMEDRGVAIDPVFLNKYAEHLDKSLKEIELPFNPFSTPKLKEYVYETLKIEPWRFTPKGEPSVDKDVLETVLASTGDPTIKNVLEYKGLYKEKGTYVDNYVKQAGLDGRIHPEMKQTTTATGRLSSANPNLQNVPVGEMRKLFVAPAGKMLVRADYDKIELRVFAALAGEEAMLEAFRVGRNIHQETADAVGMSYFDGKTLNFLMLYGGTAWGISQHFHIPIDDAQALIRQYFKKFPKIQPYFHEQVERAKETKKVSNWFGRERRLDALYTDDWRIKKEGEREAINTPIQGTAAEIVKLAMIRLKGEPMLLQIHDEIIFEVDEKRAEEYAQWLKEIVPTFVEIQGVQFPVAVSVGKNWAETSEN